MTNGTLTPPKGLEPEFIQKHTVSESMAAIANADPLPGALAKIFPIVPITIGKFSVRAPVIYDWAILKALNSPINRQILELAKLENDRVDVEYTDEESWLICWQFTRPVRDVDKVFVKGGQAAMLEQAKETFAFESFDFDLVGEIVKAVIKQIGEVWETAMSYKAEKEGEGNTTVFLPPQRLAKTV